LVKNTLPAEKIVEMALDNIEKAKEKGIALRLLGAIAIRLHSPQCSHILKSLGRYITDIDYAAYQKDEDRIFRLFTEDLNYELLSRPGVTPGLYRGRMIFSDKKHGHLHIDVFMDELRMCHTINFKDRLGIDYPTVPLAELFLEKTQIVKINQKDINDLVVTLLEHEFGEDDHDKINLKQVADILCDDWGFYYTVTINLEKVLRFADTCKALTEDEKKAIKYKINYFLDYVYRKPKSLKWKLRAKIGSKAKWYQEVEEIDRTRY